MRRRDRRPTGIRSVAEGRRLPVEAVAEDQVRKHRDHRGAEAGDQPGSAREAPTVTIDGVVTANGGGGGGGATMVKSGDSGGGGLPSANMAKGGAGALDMVATAGSGGPGSGGAILDGTSGGSESGSGSGGGGGGGGRICIRAASGKLAGIISPSASPALVTLPLP